MLKTKEVLQKTGYKEPNQRLSDFLGVSNSHPEYKIFLSFSFNPCHKIKLLYQASYFLITAFLYVFYFPNQREQLWW